METAASAPSAEVATKAFLKEELKALEMTLREEFHTALAALKQEFQEAAEAKVDTAAIRRELECAVAISQGLSSVEAHATLLVEQSECTAANMDNRLSALTGLLASYTRLPPDWPSSLALRKWDQRFRAMGPNDGLSAQEGAELLYALSTARADFVNVTRGGR